MLLLLSVDMDVCVARRGRASVCWAYGPGDASRSRKDIREVVLALVGVSSGMGEAEPARPSPGMRRVGSFEPDEVGVREELERAETGVCFDDWGGLVTLSGLKLWPVSTLFGFVDEFQRGRLPIVEAGRWILLASGVVSLEARESMARRDVGVFFGSWLAGAGIDACLRFAG